MTKTGMTLKKNRLVICRLSFAIGHFPFSIFHLPFSICLLRFVIRSDRLDGGAA